MTHTRKTYTEHKAELIARYPNGVLPADINVDDVIRLKMQNTFLMAPKILGTNFSITEAGRSKNGQKKYIPSSTSLKQAASPGIG